ncbi:lytic murein transglycosylase [Maritimibacter sp. UBA3975]|uniref:lytic murein transglycosylase n=1 Tax=Maritimibacter sp. UBA3975 TaxID=1946833 RepID=UPI000C0B8B48|nr:lytic murein transglycosylase [Maritimibacter sp. UBA3975]MAM63725.1 lytic transglycosylase [Maritimibacter sp.]|tara:strand:- start:1629 stop:2822 length:1194 start_codon:yes stop_codon:yes gene_type:complete
MKKLIAAVALSLATASPSAAQDIPAPLVECGGSFSSFVGRMKDLALSRGHDAGTVNNFFASVRQDGATLNADRGQGFFQKPFIEFSRSLISQNRIDNGRANLNRYSSVFDRMEREYGVSRGVLTAFWAFETDYGGFQGNFNTLNSLMTLSHDCRRPGLFQPQVLAALELYKSGDFSPTGTTGAWAGEIGMVQMLPSDIIEAGVDGDGDGHVRLKTSAPDALLSGANMLRELGWRANEPWLQEVVVPQNLDWTKTGTDNSLPTSQWASMGVQARNGQLRTDLPGKIILPQGHKGPAFIAYPNFDIYFEWNQSFTYVLTAAYFATRLEGGPIYDAGNPDPGLSGGQMKALQQKLQARGHDVGKIDGILGAGTRAAAQAEQARLGLPADAWPTAALLNAL